MHLVHILVKDRGQNGEKGKKKKDDKPLPNLVFILADDLGYGDVGYQNPDLTEHVTPNIDYLATHESLILTRHYVHYTCTPTRSSVQSGRLPTHVQMTLDHPDKPNSGVPRNMTLISDKLFEKGYTNYMVGKWDIGMATFDHTPRGRSYHRSLFYFEHDNEFWKQQIIATECYSNPNFSEYRNLTDLWMSNDTYDGPAYGLNGTKYEEFLFYDEVYDIITNIDNTETPFFLYYAPHATHSPLQIPKEYYDRFNYSDDEYLCKTELSTLDIEIYPREDPYEESDFHCRSQYKGMLSILDDIMLNFTNLLKDTNLWDNTLIVFSSDNGGNYDLGKNAGNNYPLKGGKFSPWEGGIHSTAFVTGGLLPPDRIGEKEDGLIHVVDWYSTFLGLVDPDPNFPLDETAEQNELPQIDSKNVWDLITGKRKRSPRKEIWIDNDTLIQRQYKYLRSENIFLAGWTGVVYPNTSSMLNATEVKQPGKTSTMDMLTVQNCSEGCLYDVVNDISEYVDISKKNKKMKAIAAEMNRRLDILLRGYYSNDEVGVDSCPDGISTDECPCWMAANHWNGFIGPWQYLGDLNDSDDVSSEYVNPPADDNVDTPVSDPDPPVVNNVNKGNEEYIIKLSPTQVYVIGSVIAVMLMFIVSISGYKMYGTVTRPSKYAKVTQIGTTDDDTDMSQIADDMQHLNEYEYSS